MSEPTMQEQLGALGDVLANRLLPFSEAIVRAAIDKIDALEAALAAQTRHATTLGAALTGQWQEDAWTDLPQLVYRPSCRPAPQRMESML